MHTVTVKHGNMTEYQARQKMTEKDTDEKKSNSKKIKSLDFVWWLCNSAILA